VCEMKEAVVALPSQGCRELSGLSVLKIEVQKRNGV